MSRAAVLTGMLVLAVATLAPWDYAHAQKVSLGIQIGTGHLPLSKWRHTSESILYSRYRADYLGLYTEGFAGVSSGRHSVKVSVGSITTSAGLFSATPMTPGPGTIVSSVDWSFLAVPIGVRYEFNLGRGNIGGPYVGLGSSYYFSRVRGEVRTLSPPDLAQLFGLQKGERHGRGYGFSGSLGYRFPIAPAWLLSTCIRGQWADGMAFTEKGMDVPVQFTGVDLSVGLEWWI